MKKIYLLIFSILCLGIGTGKAQYTVLFNFNSTNAQPYGYYPGGSLTLSGNRLYGMIQIGGSLSHWGGVFKIDTNGTNYQELVGFNTANGAAPVGSLLLAGSVLYGMTDGARYGSSWGNVFSLDTNGNIFNNLINFNKTDGEEPQGSLIISGSTLYGMTSGGGVYMDGCIFSIDSNGNNFKVLFDFNGTNGAGPNGDLTLSGGVLYGMTSGGGTHNDGLIFSMDTNGGNYKDLLNFDDTNGAYPYGSLTLVGRRIYGMTQVGGVNDSGCVFSIDTNGSSYKDLLDFNGVNGAYPWGSLTIIGRCMYGMTWEGGANQFGRIFSIDTDGSRYRDMWDFNDTNGGRPEGNNLILSGNVLYGMTTQGGLFGFGVIFKIDTATIATSINKLTTTSTTINVYPNPSNGIFTIQSSVIFGQLSVEIYNVLGQKVNIGMLKQVQHDYEIDLTGQPDGIYLYRVVKEDGSLIGEGKVVIQK